MAETSNPPIHHLRRSWVLVAAVLVAAALIALASWQILARHTLSQVEVVPKSMVCDGKPVPLALPDEYDPDGYDGEIESAFAFKMHLDTVCDLTVAYVNGSSRSARVDSALFPLLYPGDASGFVIDIGGTDDSVEPRSEADGLDARFTVGRTIKPGHWIEATYVVRYRQPTSTCSAGMIMGLGDVPATTFSSMGVHRVVDGQVHLRIRSDHPEGVGCD